MCLPNVNIVSFLSAQNSNSVAKLVSGRGYKKLANDLLAFVRVTPAHIPLTRNGEPIVFNEFKNDRDADAGIYVHKCVARLKGGIPNPKVRPVVELPWELEFDMYILEEGDVREVTLKGYIERGGLAIGLGTYRGVFGKFEIGGWD